MTARVGVENGAQERAGGAVRDIMRRDFVTVPADESLDEALRIMRLARLRHLFVERDGFLAGILSYRDLQDRALGWDHGGEPEEPVVLLPSAQPAVSEAMLASPYVVAPETRLGDAAARLTDLRVGCLPVVQSEAAGPRLVGLVTESDLLRAAYRRR